MWLSIINRWELGMPGACGCSWRYIWCWTDHTTTLGPHTSKLRTHFYSVLLPFFQIWMFIYVLFFFTSGQYGYLFFSQGTPLPQSLCHFTNIYTEFLIHLRVANIMLCQISNRPNCALDLISALA